MSRTKPLLPRQVNPLPASIFAVALSRPSATNQSSLTLTSRGNLSSRAFSYRHQVFRPIPSILAHLRFPTPHRTRQNSAASQDLGPAAFIRNTPSARPRQAQGGRSLARPFLTLPAITFSPTFWPQPLNLLFEIARMLRGMLAWPPPMALESKEYEELAKGFIFRADV